MGSDDVAVKGGDKVGIFMRTDDVAKRSIEEWKKGSDKGEEWKGRHTGKSEEEEEDRKSTRLNSSHSGESRMPSSA